MSGRGGLRKFAMGDVNLLLPALVIIGAIGVAVSDHPYIAVGIAVGAVLAYVNSGLLAKRIMLAATTGNAGAAMISMQVGLLVTFTVVGAITVGMVLNSRPMTVAMAICFFVVQTAELVLYYRARKRTCDCFYRGYDARGGDIVPAQVLAAPRYPLGNTGGS